MGEHDFALTVLKFSIKETYVLWQVLFVDDGMGKENLTDDESAIHLYRFLEKSIFRGGDFDTVGRYSDWFLLKL